MNSAKVLSNMEGQVAIGSTVEIQWDDGSRGTYLIGTESDVARNVVAPDAPLSRAIYGAIAGDVRTYRSGCRLWTVTVLHVGGPAHV